jgi:DNA invertase Pin-like site-specific DNA recombinase
LPSAFALRLGFYGVPFVPNDDKRVDHPSQVAWVAWRVSARPMKDLQDIVHDLKRRGIALKATEQPIDTSNAAGKAFLDMLGVFAEFETNLRRERQAEGIAKKKSEGGYKGRVPSIDREQLAQLRAEGLGATETARRLKISRESVYLLQKQAN